MNWTDEIEESMPLSMDEFASPGDPAHLGDAAKALSTLKQAETQAKKEYEDLKAQRMEAENTLLALLELAGINSIRTDEGTFYTREDWYASIIPDAKAEIFRWFKGNGMAGMVQETISAKTLSAWAKEIITEGGEVPEGINVNIIKRIGTRKK
jgi:hypothetical protein